MKRRTVISIALITLICFIANAQARYPWKEMAALNFYNFKPPTWWNYYHAYPEKKREVYSYIRAARELGFNMVRIPLDFIPRNFVDPHDNDQHPPYYDHGWADSTDVGSGHVFIHPESRAYINDIDSMIQFCTRNKMRIHLLLGHGLGTKNSPAEGEEDNYYYRAEPKPLTQARRYDAMNKWFKDAAAWFDFVLGNIDLGNVEVLEIENEADPTSALAADSYPTLFYSDVYMVEMCNYVHHKWPNLKLAISLHQSGGANAWMYLKKMLHNAGHYKRPPEINYTEYPLDEVYFDWMSYHNYNTGTWKYEFQQILNLDDLQPSQHHYQWFFGEFGYDISDVQSYESDQAKFFENHLVFADELYDQLNPTPHHLAGLGIWSVFDYVYPGEPGRFGLLQNEAQQIRKRKAADVVENFLQGPIDNPTFDIGTADDTICSQGWTYWHESTNVMHRNDYTVITDDPARGTILQLNSPSGAKEIGFANDKGRIMRVRPNTNIRVDVDVNIAGRLTGQVFSILKWYDSGMHPVSTASYDYSNHAKDPSPWLTMSQTFAVPPGVCYAVLMLMGWNLAGTTVQFDNVRVIPEWRPLITFTFDDDPQHYFKDDVLPARGANGWTGLQNISFLRRDRVGVLTGTGAIATMHQSNSRQITAIGVRRNYTYAATAIAASERGKSGSLKLFSLVSDQVNDTPTWAAGKAGTECYIADTSLSLISTQSINVGNSDWAMIQPTNWGNWTKLKEITLFENVVNGGRAENNH